MTREEVVKWLESLKRETGKAENRTLWHYAESIDMAIKALKGADGDLISRADVLEGLKHSTAYLHDDIYTIVNRIPSAEATGALDEAITKYVANGYMLPPSTLTALPSATCDDCIWHICNYNKIDWEGEDGYISRRDAVNEIDEWIQRATDNETDVAIKEFLSFLKERINTLPSAELKTGKRIKDPSFCEKCKHWESNTGFCYEIADSDTHECHFEKK